MEATATVQELAIGLSRRSADLIDRYRRQSTTRFNGNIVFANNLDSS